ncbi:MAG: phosphate signaling complex protein PhoU [Lentisphaeria bacterium]
MLTHLHKEIDRLENRVLELGAVVEENINKAVRAFEGRDIEVARQVIESDKEVDEMEVELEEECLKMLALYQPVAVDLRVIISALKINNDLERVGDLAANIAKCTEPYAEYPAITPPVDIHAMAQKALALLRSSLDAFVQLDMDLAYKVRQQDNEVDAYDREVEIRVKEAIKKQPEYDEGYLQIIWVGRHIERVADHATNIAEDIIYMLKGEIVRHKKNGKTEAPKT